MICDIFSTKARTFVLNALIVAFSSNAFAETSMKVAELKKNLREISTLKANCQTEKCDNLKLYTDYERVLKSALETRLKMDLLLEENQSLKNQAQNLESKLPLPKEAGCDKARILQEKMIDLGINKNGNLIFNKRPAGMDGAQCWSNSKKKKQATLTLCEFPLAINILSVGGDPTHPIERKQEYIFDLKACNLVSVNVSDDLGNNKRKSMVLTIPTCVNYWNKRTADATMTKAQVREMEETIEQCFKHGLLPINEPSPKPVKPAAGKQKAS